MEDREYSYIYSEFNTSIKSEELAIKEVHIKANEEGVIIDSMVIDFIKDSNFMKFIRAKFFID